MKILQHTISTKAGETQSLRWLVVQSRPHPRISGECSRLQWQNFEGLFSSYQNPARGLGKTYTAYLLATGATPGEKYSRADFAGFVDYHSREVKPGSIRFRGKDVGETSVTLATTPNDFPSIRVGDGCENATGAIRKLIEETIVPALRSFIAEHAKELREDAIAAVLERMRSEVAEKRAELDQLEAKISEATF